MCRKILIFIIFATVNQSVFAVGNTENTTTGKDATGIVNRGDNNVTIITRTTGISEEMYDRLSEKYHVTKSALKSFFKILEKEQVSSEDLDSTLREIAKRYKELLAKVDTLKSDDESVKSLILQAKQALRNGEFDTAERLFNEASDLDIVAMKQARAELEQMQKIINKRAESKAANGELKLAQLTYQAEGEYYQKAAELLPEGNEETLALYLNNAGTAFYEAGLYNKAKPLYERSLSIKEKVLGAEHPETANGLNNLTSCATIYNSLIFMIRKF